MSPSPPLATEQTAYLALGSNLGDRRGQLQEALARLAAAPGNRVSAVSSFYETPAVGLPGAPAFLNAAARIETRLAPEALLALCLRIEAALGRVRSGRRESRPIDLDLLLYSGQVRAGPALTLPHPRLLERAFVLLPLAEIAPEEEVAGHPVAYWAARVSAAGIRKVT